MPVQMQYNEAEHIIHYIATDPWTMEEMANETQKSKKILDNASQPIYTLVDTTQARAMPQGALRGRSNPEMTHPNSAGIVIVGASVLVRTIAGVVAKLANMQNLVFFENLDDGWAYIRSKTTQPTL